MAQPERRYDVTPVTRAGAYLVATRVASGVGVGKKSWIRRRGWHAGHEHGWFAVAVAVLTSCAGGGNIEGSAAPSRSASQLPTSPCRLPTRSAARRRFPVRRRRNPVPRSHRAGLQRGRQPLKNRRRRHRRRGIPRGHRSARRPPPRPGQSLPLRVRRPSPGR